MCSMDSPGERDGKEVIFQVCSDRCGDALTLAINKENNLSSKSEPRDAAEK